MGPRAIITATLSMMVRKPLGSRWPQFIALKPTVVVRVQAIEPEAHQSHIEAFDSVAHELHEFRFRNRAAPVPVHLVKPVA